MMNEIGPLLREKTGQLERWCLQQSNKSNDVYALSLLQPLLVGRPQLAFTNSALRPHCMATLVNDIAVNRRRRIVEFGSGISTVMMARLIDLNGLDAKIVSIEHDAGWLEAVRSMLEAEQLLRHVELVHAPLAPCPLSRTGTAWYDLEAIDRAVPPSGVDMAVVDGPPAYEEGKSDARYPALPYVFSRLASSACVCLDDFERPGEQKIVESWELDFPVTFTADAGSMAVALIGQCFNIRPFSYA